MQAVQTQPMQASALPFGVDPLVCDRCYGLGWRIAPLGHVETCPVIAIGGNHGDLTAEGQLIDRCIRNLKFRKLDVDPRHFDVARSLAQFDAATPCSRRELIDRHFTYKPGAENQRRLVTNAVRFLRDIWFLPVGSRKVAPTGYWIITNEADFIEWVDRVKQEPITHLSTIHRLAKANYPLFGEQLEIEFWSDISSDG